jgi:transcriptional regulator with XRE-family HTH domain
MNMTQNKNRNGFIGTRQENDYLTGVDEVTAGGEAPALDEDLPVGGRVRQIRKQKGLTLKDVAQRTGMNEDALAKIENGEANPPLGELIKLGKALDMKMGTLIASGEDRPYTVVRSSERQDVSRYPHSRQTSYGYSYQALAPEKRNRSMEPFMVTLRRGEEEAPLSTHDGEEFIFVMEGDMEAIVGEAREVLKPGDSIYYDSTVPHLVRPAGEGPTLILAVLYSQGS